MDWQEQSGEPSPRRALSCAEPYVYGTEGESGDSENKIIHGDNLTALKSLLPEYEGRVKLVYIDPPYNTGNEGWVYNDNVNDPQIKKWLGEVVGKEGEDLSRHDEYSDGWLIFAQDGIYLKAAFCLFFSQLSYFVSGKGEENHGIPI